MYVRRRVSALEYESIAGSFPRDPLAEVNL